MSARKKPPAVAIEANESEDGYTTIDLDWIGTDGGESALVTQVGVCLTLDDQHIVQLYRRLKWWMKSRQERL